MYKDVLKGKWKQLHGQIKAWWCVFTHNNLEFDHAKFEIFDGLLQERYGHPGGLTKDEIEKRISKYQISSGSKKLTLSK